MYINNNTYVTTKHKIIVNFISITKIVAMNKISNINHNSHRRENNVKWNGTTEQLQDILSREYV